MRPALSFILCAACLSGALAVSLPVQQQGKGDDLVLKLPTDLAVLDAQVLSRKSGQPLGNLKSMDFILSEDGVQQEITHFNYNKLPLSIVLLLDVSESVWPGIGKIRTAALQSLQLLKPEDEVALMTFAYSASLIQDFTRDKKLLAQKMYSIEDFKAHGTRVNTALHHAASYLSKASNPGNRRVILAITDNQSQPISDVEVSTQEVRNELLEIGIVTCGLIVGPFEYESRSWKIVKHLPPIAIADKVLAKRNKEDFKDYLLPHIDATGGVALTAKEKEINLKFSHIIQRLRARYSFGYIPINQNMDGKFRKIKVRVTPEIEKREGGVIILARQGYYARPRSNNTNSTPNNAGSTKPKQD